MQHYIAVKKGEREKTFYIMIRENLQDTMLKKKNQCLKECAKEANFTVNK